MSTKKKFYGVMVAVILAFLVNAIIRTSRYNGRKGIKRYESFETLTYQQIVDREKALVETFHDRPASAKVVYANMGRGYALIDSAQKAMLYPLPIEVDSKRRDMRMDDIVRGIPLTVQQEIDEYSKNYLAAFAGTPEQEAALREFQKSGLDPTMRPEISVPGFEVVFWSWCWFQIGAACFFPVHFAIRLREQGLKIFHDVAANPMFWVWSFFWEIGFFRYPMKITLQEQLQRARIWATFVLSSAMSCFAGTGKVCNEKKERAPQHQQYDGLWSRFAFSTGTMSNYVGLDGGVFFLAPVQQSTATVTLPCGMYAGLFNSEPLGRMGLRPNYGQEIDGTFGWTGKSSGFSFDVNATYTDVFPLIRLPRGDVIQGGERVTRRIPLGKRNAVSPYLWFRQAAPVRGSTPVGGNFIHGGVTTSHAFSDRVSVSVTTEALHDSGAFGYRPGFIARVVEGLNWKRNGGVTWQFPQVTFTDPLSHTADGRRPTLVFGVGLLFSPAH